MDTVTSSPVTSYSRLEEDKTPSHLPEATPSSSLPITDDPLNKVKEEECQVTIIFGEVLSLKDLEASYRCTMNHVCGCSLRAACIAITVLFALYLATHISIFIATVVIMSIENMMALATAYFINVALIESVVAAFIVPFMCVGIHKRNSRRLHVAKWLMIMDLCLNVVLQVQFYKIFGPISLCNLGIQVFPLCFIFVVHSYEAQLVIEAARRQLKKANSRIAADATV